MLIEIVANGMCSRITDSIRVNDAMSVTSKHNTVPLIASAFEHSRDSLFSISSEGERSISITLRMESGTFPP